MRNRWYVPFVRSVQNHPVYYAVWFFLFIGGISCGFHTIRLFAQSDSFAFTSAITTWLDGYVYHQKDFLGLLLSSVLLHGRWMLMLMLSGLFRFGSIFIFAVPAIRGYEIGSTAAMFLVSFGIGGLLSAMLILLFQNFILIPCFAQTGSYALIQIQTNHRIHSARYCFHFTFIFFVAAVIMECSILPLIIGVLGSMYV